MLSDNEIRRRIDSGDLSLRYIAVPEKDGHFSVLGRSHDCKETPDTLALLERSTIRSRIGLSVGPLLHPMDNGIVPRLKRFAGHKRVVDLRKCPHGWKLPPGQSAVFFTNEWFRLPADVTGLILSRVANYNNGAFVHTSYVDSLWQGILKLHIANLSNYPFKIYLGQEVAWLVLFETPAASPAAGEVRDGAMHFAYSWERILEEEVNPFHENAPVFPDSGHAFTARRADEMVKRVFGVGLIVVLLAAAKPMWALMQSAGGIQRANVELARLNAEVARMKAVAAVSGYETIQIDAGEIQAEKIIDLPGGSRMGYTLARVVSGPLGASASARILSRPEGPALSVTGGLAAPARARTIVEINWAVIP